MLQEFYAVVTGKLASPLSPADAVTAIEAFAQLPLVTVTPEIVLGAAGLHRSDSLSFRDALIVEAARAGGAEVLYTEDLQHGRRFGDVTVEDPFLTAGEGPAL